MFTDHASSGQPTEQRAAGKATRERRAQIAAFYAHQSGRLLQLVRRDLRVDSHAAEDIKIDTPHLDVRYQAKDFSALREMGATWKLITRRARRCP